MALRRSWAGYVVWGSIAVCAVLGAAFTIALVVGAHRGIQFAGPLKRTAPLASERPQAKAAVAATTRHDIARIDDALRALADERDRLAARVEQLERSLGDITASIEAEQQSTPVDSGAAAPMGAPANDTDIAHASRTERPENPEQVEATSTAPRPAPAKQARTTRQPDGPSIPDNPLDIFRPYASVQPPVPPPAPAIAPMQIHAAPQKSASNTTRTEFAIDLGVEESLGGLRALWAGLRGDHGAALSGLHPLVSLREGDKPGRTELHLIAGPLVNAGAAARICAGLQAKGVTCQTTVFDGQRLTVR